MAGRNASKKPDRDAEGGAPIRDTWKKHKANPDHVSKSTKKMRLGRKLLEAVKKGDFEGVRELLLKRADANTENDVGWTPLMLASSHGYIKIARMLIDGRADVNARNEMGMTPLMYAAAGGRAVVVKLLIERGADVKAKNDFGMTALGMARANKREDSPERFRDTIRILREHGARK